MIKISDIYSDASHDLQYINKFNVASYWQTSYFLPRDARPYRTPVAKAMAFPNKVVREKLRHTGNRAILKIGNQRRQPTRDKIISQSIILSTCYR